MGIEYREESYLGNGKLYARLYGAAAGFKRMGNAPQLQLGIEEDVKRLPNNQTSGGGNLNIVRRVTQMDAKLAFTDFSAERMADAVFGDASIIAAGSAVDESITLYPDALTPLDKFNPDAGTLVLTSDPAGTTYVEGTDYELRPEGVWIFGDGAIAVATPALASYDYPEQDLVQALMNSGRSIEFLAALKNEAKDDAPIRMRSFRMKLGSANSLDFIADDFGKIEIAGEMLADPNRGNTVSAYLTIEK